MYYINIQLFFESNNKYNAYVAMRKCNIVASTLNAIYNINILYIRKALKIQADVVLPY